MGEGKTKKDHLNYIKKHQGLTNNGLIPIIQIQQLNFNYILRGKTYFVVLYEERISRFPDRDFPVVHFLQKISLDVPL